MSRQSKERRRLRRENERCIHTKLAPFLGRVRSPALMLEMEAALEAYGGHPPKGVGLVFNQTGEGCVFGGVIEGVHWQKGADCIQLTKTE